MSLLRGPSEVILPQPTLLMRVAALGFARYARALSTRSQSFGIGDLVEVETPNVRALARVRESSGGRLHLALEVGEYLPWVDDQVLIRRVGSDAHPCAAKILHAGSSTALLQIIEIVEEAKTPPAGLPGLQDSSLALPGQAGIPAPPQQTSSTPPVVPPIDDDW